MHLSTSGTQLQLSSIVPCVSYRDSGIEADGMGIELFNVRLEDPLSGTPGTSSSLSINIDGDEPGEDSEHQKGGKNAKEGNRNKPWGSLFGSEHDLEPHLDLQTWPPDIRLTFQGTHVFACVRKLVDSGAVDGVRMPGWMTGEAGVSGGVVRDGIVKVKEGRL